MVKYIFWAIVFYLMIRFIFNFVIPVFRATKQMRSQVKNFQNKMQEQEEFRSGSFQNKQAQPQAEAKKGDYIDFEEIK